MGTFSIVTLVKGMKVFGEEDPAVTRRIEEAVGEWGHLAAFPVEHRQHLSVFLGVMPTYCTFRTAWRVCGHRGDQFDQLGVRYIVRHNVLAISRVGSGGRQLADAFDGDDEDDTVRIMGDHFDDAPVGRESLVEACTEIDVLDLCRQVDEVRARNGGVVDESVDELVGDKDLVQVVGTGLMDSVVEQEQRENFERFMRDMRIEGLPEFAEQALRDAILRAPVLTETMLGGGMPEYEDEAVDVGHGCDRGRNVADQASEGSSRQCGRDEIMRRAGTSLHFEGDVYHPLDCVNSRVDLSVLQPRYAAARRRADQLTVKTLADPKCSLRRKLCTCNAEHAVLSLREAAGGVYSHKEEITPVESVKEDCHAVLTRTKLSDMSVSIRTLVESGQLLSDAHLAQFSMTMSTPTSWHVTRHGVGLNVLAAVRAARDALVKGSEVILVAGRALYMSHTVGIGTEYARVLVSELKLSCEPDKLDESGLNLAVRPLSSMTSDEQRRARMLQVVGDSALTLALASICRDRDKSAQDFQETRNVVTGNKRLTEAFVQSKYIGAMPWFGTNVSPKIGSAVVEATIGSLYIADGLHAVKSYCKDIGLFD